MFIKLEPQHFYKYSLGCQYLIIPIEDINRVVKNTDEDYFVLEYSGGRFACYLSREGFDYVSSKLVP